MSGIRWCLEYRSYEEWDSIGIWRIPSEEILKKEKLCQKKREEWRWGDQGSFEALEPENSSG